MNVKPQYAAGWLSGFLTAKWLFFFRRAAEGKDNRRRRVSRWNNGGDVGGGGGFGLGVGGGQILVLSHAVELSAV